MSIVQGNSALLQPPPSAPPLVPQVHVQVESDYSEPDFNIKKHRLYLPSEQKLERPRDYCNKLRAHFEDSCAETIL